MGLANLAQQDVYLGPMANLYYVCKNVYNEIDTHQKKFHNGLTMNGHSSIQEYIYGSQQAMRIGWFL